MSSDLTILVASCDSYSDVLGHFTKLFAKFWPDCPFPVALVTESQPAKQTTNDIFSTFVACGRGKTWSGMLVEALDAITTPYVMLMMDDYFLSAKVDTALIQERLADAKRLTAASIRLIPNPLTFKPYNETYGIYPPNKAYCVSCQVSITAKDFMRRIASQTASAWEFERRGSYLCGDEKRPILVTLTQQFPFIDAVHKGYWEKFAIALCRENSIAIDFVRRPPPPLKIRLKEGVKALIFRMFPKDWIVRTQNLLIK